MDKGMILKTAAVVSCVIALGITGCQGGNNEAAAVKNKSNIEVSIQNAKGESVDVQRDGKEDIEAVGRSAEPARENAEASSNDNERSEEKGRTDPKADSKAEQPEDEDNNAGEKDRGTDSSSEPLGTGDGFNAASAVSSISDMESTDSAGWDGGMENDSAVSEYSESGYTEQYGYDSESESYDDSNEQYGDTEYSEDTDNGWSDGYDESVPELVDSGDASEEAGSDYYGDEEMTFLGTWASTGYCACELCCGQWSSGYTASGTWATEGITCACGMFDFGTVLYIEGFGYRVVEDRGVEGEFVDIFYSSHDAASAHGLQYVNVYLVN